MPYENDETFGREHATPSAFADAVLFLTAIALAALAFIILLR